MWRMKELFGFNNSSNNGNINNINNNVTIIIIN